MGNATEWLHFGPFKLIEPDRMNATEWLRLYVKDIDHSGLSVKLVILDAKQAGFTTKELLRAIKTLRTEEVIFEQIGVIYKDTKHPSEETPNHQEEGIPS